MKISIGSYKIRSNFLLASVVLFLVIFGYILWSFNVRLFEGLETETDTDTWEQDAQGLEIQQQEAQELEIQQELEIARLRQEAADTESSDAEKALEIANQQLAVANDVKRKADLALDRARSYFNSLKI